MIKAYDVNKDVFKGIKLPPTEEEEVVEEEENDTEENVVIDQNDIFKPKEENSIKLEIAPITTMLPPPKPKKERKKNKNKGRKCTEKQLKHMAAMRVKASAALTRKAQQRLAQKHIDEDRKEKVEKTIYELNKRVAKPKKSKEDKHTEFFEMMDAYYEDKIKKQKLKPKPKPVPKKVHFEPSIPHPNRRVPKRHRPVPPPSVPPSQFASLFGGRTNNRVSWRS